MYTSTPASLDDSRTACEANAGYRLAHYTDQDSYDDVHDIVGELETMRIKNAYFKSIVIHSQRIALQRLDRTEESQWTLMHRG